MCLAQGPQPSDAGEARTLLYLDLYVLGDALISKGSFMQTKYLCVLIHI